MSGRAMAAVSASLRCGLNRSARRSPRWPPTTVPRCLGCATSRRQELRRTPVFSRTWNSAWWRARKPTTSARPARPVIRTYSLRQGVPNKTDLEIIKNYAEALPAAGFRITNTDRADDQKIDATMTKDGVETWVHVWPSNGNGVGVVVLRDRTVPLDDRAAGRQRLRAGAGAARLRGDQPAADSAISTRWNSGWWRAMRQITSPSRARRASRTTDCGMASRPRPTWRSCRTTPRRCQRQGCGSPIPIAAMTRKFSRR